MSEINKPAYNLFWRKGWHWFLNIKDIPIFLRRVVFAAKHGYAEPATWETFAWFTSVMQEILTNYRDNRMGTSIVINDYDGSSESEIHNMEAYDAILNKMIHLLYIMDEDNECSDDNQRNVAKDEFFKLFSKYFYTFWD